jgi:general secretion pathway protein G
VPRFVGQTDKARRVKAQADIRAIEEALNLFRLDNGFYPSTAEGLEALVTAPPRARSFNPDGYLDDVPVDPWQNPYAYFSDGREIVIKSFGADGQEGGDDDITNHDL